MTDVREMSLQELSELEQQVKTRKQELLAQFDCDFDNSELGYFAKLEFPFDPKEVVLLGTYKGQRRIPWRVCLPHQVYFKDLMIRIRGDTDLLKIEALGVSEQQRKTIWEASQL